MNQFKLKEGRIKVRNTFVRKAIGIYHGLFFTLLILGTGACDGNKKLLEVEVWDGPSITMNDVNTLMSDSGMLTMRLKASRQLEYENGNREWPYGLYLEYLNKEGQVTTTFKSNHATYNDEEGLYKGMGNVLVRNMRTGDELNTEELYWKPKEELFYTEKFVTILSDGEIHTGEGLTAQDNFDTYEIHKPAGTIRIEEDESI